MMPKSSQGLRSRRGWGSWSQCRTRGAGSSKPRQGCAAVGEGQLYVSTLLGPPRLQLLKEEMIWGWRRGPGRLNKPPLPSTGAGGLPPPPHLLGKKYLWPFVFPLLHVCLSVVIVGTIYGPLHQKHHLVACAFRLMVTAWPGSAHPHENGANLPL